MKELCDKYEVNYYNLYDKVTQRADYSPNKVGGTITVQLSVGEQRILREALELAGGL